MYRPLHIDRNWVFLEPVPVPRALISLGNYPDIVFHTLTRRGFNDIHLARQFIDPAAYEPSPPVELPDMDRAVSRILHAVDSAQRIGVWGDFDVDGQTSTAILISALRTLGTDPVFHIPVREIETHGIGMAPLQTFLDQGPELILTCDTGVSSFDAVKYAQSRGVDVIITDHHELPETLPPAYALVNPHRLPEGHRLSSLPGAGTAFKLAEALLTERQMAEKARHLFDLAALGCVADLASLTGETRYLVQSGLNQLRTNPRPALAALLQSSSVEIMRTSEEHISFALAPRLNAVGRLSDANPIVNFLLSENPVEIAVMVNQIEGLNTQRKYLSDQVFQGALTQLEQERSLLDQPILILHHQEWPAGVVGIVASRLVEIFHRPVILLVAPPGKAIHGSARSIVGLDILAALTKNKDLLLSYGGHAMAAGLSLQPEDLEAFKRRMYKTLSESDSTRSAGAELMIDAVIPPSTVTLDFARALDVLAPFGPGNPALLFMAEKMRLVNSRAVGKMNEHLLLDLEDQRGETSRFMWWNGADLPLPDGEFDLAYTFRENNYQGIEQVQFEWVDFRQTRQNGTIEIQQDNHSILHFDYRDSKTPLEDLAQCAATPGLSIWKEGSYSQKVAGVDRLNIQQGETLAVWSIPPDIHVLRHLFLSAHPRQVCWFLVAPAEHQVPGFLHTLGKWVKEGLRLKQQHYTLSDMAHKSATTVDMVALGLKWLASSGHISILEESPSSYHLVSGGVSDARLKEHLQKELKHSFAELHSFSNYLLHVDLQKLVNELI